MADVNRDTERGGSKNYRQKLAAIESLKRWHASLIETRTSDDGEREISDETRLLKAHLSRRAGPLPLSPDINLGWGRTARLEAATIPHRNPAAQVDFGLRITFEQRTQAGSQDSVVARSHVPVYEFGKDLLDRVPTAAVKGLARRLEAVQGYVDRAVSKG